MWGAFVCYEMRWKGRQAYLYALWVAVDAAPELPGSLSESPFHPHWRRPLVPLFRRGRGCRCRRGWRALEKPTRRSCRQNNHSDCNSPINRLTVGSKSVSDRRISAIFLMECNTVVWCLPPN